MKMSQLIENESRNQPELVVCIGLPGSGKSYQIKRRYPNHTVISSDDLIEAWSASEGLTYDEGFKKFIKRATATMRTNFNTAVKNNEDIVWDQTNLGAKKRRGILQQIPNNYRTVALVLDVDESVRQQRAAGREGKTIPSHVMQSMVNNFQIPTEDEGFDEIITIKE